MRPVIILLGVLVIVLGAVYLQQRHTDRDQLTASQAQTQTANDARQSSQTELATFKSQQAVITTQLKQQITTLEAAAVAQRQQAQQQIEASQQELAAAKKTSQTQTEQLTTLQKEKEKLVAESATLAGQLHDAKQQLAAPASTPAATVTTPDPQTSLELVACQVRWNSLTAVAAQLRLLKKQQHDQRIADWKRRDANAGALGNRGVLLHNGQWSSIQPTINVTF